jgi:L-ascorbate metabolism protein UlaG (beta-lactamase superfamily)
MITLTEHPYTEALKDSLAQPVSQVRDVNLWWLGQAGFAIKYADTVLLLDPYLSDFLAKKYKGKEFPHIRMMESPLLPEEVENIRLVLCTHRHSDHMDPETLLPTAHNNPDCLFVIPRAEQAWGKELGLPDNRIHAINAEETCTLADGITIAAIPAAHEEIKMNAQGEHYFLGYLVTLGEITFYHSSDCLPYPNLEEWFHSQKVDVALLPVNGHDEFRRSRNVPGNFILDEAVALCHQVNIPIMLGHHFGMFDFNTVDPDEAEADFQQICGPLRGGLAKVSIKYVINR